MKIVVSLKRKWGKELFYPLSEDAIFLSKVTGRPTLLKYQLKLFADRGWIVEIQQEPIDVEKILGDNHE